MFKAIIFEGELFSVLLFLFLGISKGEAMTKGGKNE
jgi:hypothetical protein